MNRRTFLKLTGMGSLSLAAGCTGDPEKTLYALVRQPEDMVTGEATWYATTCRECPAGCGVHAKTREGRVIKLEGNPEHPVNRGKLCMRGQSALQAIYDPDRLKSPLIRKNDAYEPVSFAEAIAILDAKTTEAARKGRGRVQMISEVVGSPLRDLFDDALRRWNSPPCLIYEPYGYENLKAAFKTVFGRPGIPSFRMEKADLLISFGADFLETWLSPVEYARKFKQMHAYENGGKGMFIFVAPYQLLTGTNADQWLACAPGTEAAVAFGLIRSALAAGRGVGLPVSVYQWLKGITETYSAAEVSRRTGIEPQAFQDLSETMLRAEKPLVLGAPTAGCGDAAFITDTAALLLNATLDPQLRRFDFENRHRVETADRRDAIDAVFASPEGRGPSVLLLNNVNPAYSLCGGNAVALLGRADIFTVCFSNFMDETAALADMVIPVELPLESWDIYDGKPRAVSTLQPAMGRLYDFPHIGDVMLHAAYEKGASTGGYKGRLYDWMTRNGRIRTEMDWLTTLRQGGIFSESDAEKSGRRWTLLERIDVRMDLTRAARQTEPILLVAPSLRHFDGRGANRPWLSEIPDPVTQVAWQTPLLMHPETLRENGLHHEEIVEISARHRTVTTGVYASRCVHPGAVLATAGQGHGAYGRYAQNKGIDLFGLLPSRTVANSGGPWFAAGEAAIKGTGKSMAFAHTDGSRLQHDRKIALTVTREMLEHPEKTGAHEAGLRMADFPFTLPLPEGYDPDTDIYPSHEHAGYRWGMVVDLDRCIGCSACASACYAENNLGIVGERQVINGREMSWLRIERYQDPVDMTKFIYIPMLCQHCDNAPCEPVCPVYAPHHNKEGINNQIYNRCIGTRFCAQNCPYKVRRFNWFEWRWPKPLDLQLNPDVTVRTKGVMEKCSFCIHRIKHAHGAAKNQDRNIRDGEVIPACVQTCPTGALTFGNLMDPHSRVRRLANDKRAYQVMGYLNTKPAVIYLKKVLANGG